MYALMWPREPESNARTGGATQLYGLHATYIIHCFGCVYFSASTFSFSHPLPADRRPRENCGERSENTVLTVVFFFFLLFLRTLRLLFVSSFYF